VARTSLAGRSGRSGSLPRSGRTCTLIQSPQRDASSGSRSRALTRALATSLASPNRTVTPFLVGHQPPERLRSHKRTERNGRPLKESRVTRSSSRPSLCGASLPGPGRGQVAGSVASADSDGRGGPTWAVLQGSTAGGREALLLLFEGCPQPCSRRGDDVDGWRLLFELRSPPLGLQSLPMWGLREQWSTRSTWSTFGRERGPLYGNIIIFTLFFCLQGRFHTQRRK
jgi:hypothetical protein